MHADLPRGGWPAELVAVRHGQSLANLLVPAADAAGREDSGLGHTDDAIVPLTGLGRAQADEVGRALALGPPFDAVITSSYVRAQQTTAIALAHLRPPPPVRVDARLRDREKGVLALLTEAAVRRRYPAELAARERDGEFRFRPTGGEAMADVGVRVRSVLAGLSDVYAGRRVLLVAHDAVVLMLRHAIEDIPDDDVWGLGPVPNGSVTRWLADGDRLRPAP